MLTQHRLEGHAGTIIATMELREGLRRVQRWARPHAPLIVLTAVVVWWATNLHHRGHTWGDDFALYLRQADSLFNGDVGRVIADNHFNVDNAAKPGFSPYVYPWGYPVLLAPVSRLFGLDFAALKMVAVVCFVVFLWFFFAVVRRRMAYWPAVGVVAVTATSLYYLNHTDYLVSEMPYMAAAAITLWYLDRLRDSQPLDAATRRQLVTLGLFAMCLFNVRREGLAVVLAIGVAQLFDLRGRWRDVEWRHVATPYAAFVGGVIAVQLVLPSALAPRYDDAGLHQTWRKLQGPFRGAFASQIGFDDLAGTGLLLVFLMVVAGLALRLYTSAATDLPLAVFAIGSMIAVGTIPALADRYLMGITPFAVYFGAQAVAGVRLPRDAGRWLATAALATITVAHLTELPSSVAAARDFNDRGLVVEGPETDHAQEAFAAVRRFTHQDDVVSFFKVRALTFYTDRRGVQSDVLEIVRQRSDYFLMRIGMAGGQALVTDAEAASMGWTEVWRNDQWVLWRLPLYGSP